MSDVEKTGFRIGVDLGGTKIEIIGLSDDGQEKIRYRVPTPSNSYNEIIHTICDLVHSVESEVGLMGAVGLAMPGAISSDSGLVKNSNTTCLNGKLFNKDLEERLGRKIKVANDANCFTLSEAVDGAAKSSQVVFGVILGTGTGGAVVIDKKVYEGRNLIAGEWGHNPFPSVLGEEVFPCYCGKQGCVETFLSGPAIEREYFLRTKEKLSVKEIDLLAQSGNRQAMGLLECYCDRLARGLSGVINILDPDVVVLGGGVSNLNSIYEIVPKIWGKYIFSDKVETRILKAKHGDSSGVRGAAWL